MANTNKKTAKHLSLINKKKKCKICGEYGTYQKTLFCYDDFREHQRKYMVHRRKLVKSLWVKDHYWEQWKLQGNKCAICGATTNNADQDFSSDHNHITGQLRGVLCHKCNTNVGIIENKNIHYVKQIIDYLDSWM